MYNNFCQYDEGAKKIKADESVTVQQRSSKCGVLWRSLEKQTQAKFKDAEFLSTLPNPFLDKTEDPIIESGLADNHATESAPVYGRKALASRTQKGRKVARPSLFDAVRWGSKIKTNQNSHLVEGFMVLVYPHKKGRAVLTGGSPMGKRFMDMFPNNANPTNDFLDFVKGHIALSNVLGCHAPLPTKTRKTIKDTVAPCPDYKGSLEKNIDAVRKQLGYAIYKASGGTWLNGWPGANTLKQMEKLKLAIRIKPNNKKFHVKDICKRPSDLGIGQSNQILTALANAARPSGVRTPIRTPRKNGVHTPLWKGVQGLHAFPRTLHAMCMPTIGVQALHACRLTTLIRVPSGTLIRVPNGTLIRVPNGTLIRVPNGTLIRVPNGTLIRVPNGTLIRVPNGTLIRVPNGTLIRVPNGTLMRVPNGTLIRVPFGTLIRVPNGTLIRVPNGTLIRVPL
ncbi:hypothetical protein PCANC_22065 [Puccinia coronata f. sp. avenae]|uniref:Uncharacterized protein n=1 Tax=Puccinia coronata f. sp. avenae TaxID=200324 RepID=A0A2N5UIZ4_9BASI|nr:hypothetical protein PCANC_22065 [Puccinia coronata f. sp. avenae]